MYMTFLSVDWTNKFEYYTRLDYFTVTNSIFRKFQIQRYVTLDQLHVCVYMHQQEIKTVYGKLLGVTANRHTGRQTDKFTITHYAHNGFTHKATSKNIHILYS